MSFINKLKSGVTEAGNKAKLVVEINRLKMQNNNKKSEIDEQFQQIGKYVYESRQDHEWPNLSTDVLQPHMDRIAQLQSEIEANLEQIATLSDEKPCKACGKTVALDAKFCPDCGSTFEAASDVSVPLDAEDADPQDKQ
ncbi:zinc ribbon domain-containing protein [Paenibacillus marinisediminis]